MTRCSFPLSSFRLTSRTRDDGSTTIPWSRTRSRISIRLASSGLINARRSASLRQRGAEFDLLTTVTLGLRPQTGRDTVTLQPCNLASLPRPVKRGTSIVSHIDSRKGGAVVGEDGQNCQNATPDALYEFVRVSRSALARATAVRDLVLVTTQLASLNISNAASTMP